MDNLHEDYTEAATKSQDVYAKKLAEEWNLVVDPALYSLLPRDPEEVRMLEGQIVEEGCRDAIVVWKETNIIVDGNTRYEICKRNDIPFAVIYMSFECKSAAMQWAKDNQTSRRNMSKPDLIDVNHKIEGQIRAEARERQLSTLRQNADTPNLAERSKGESRDKLAEMSGVGHTTYQKGTHILDNAPEPIKQAWKQEKLSTDAAYEATKLDESDMQEVIDIIEKGEDIKKGVGDVLKRARKPSNNPRGWTKEDRERRELTRQVLDYTHNAPIPDYTLDMLVNEIKLDADNYFSSLNFRLTSNAALISGENADTIGNLIDDYVICGIEEIRRKVS